MEQYETLLYCGNPFLWISSGKVTYSDVTHGKIHPGFSNGHRYWSPENIYGAYQIFNFFVKEIEAFFTDFFQMGCTNFIL